MLIRASRDYHETHAGIEVNAGRAVVDAERLHAAQEATSRESYIQANGHQAIRWLEQYADGQGCEDQLIQAEEYFWLAERAAESSLFDPHSSKRDEFEIGYGIASWLYGLIGFSPNWLNVLDYYLLNFSKEFYAWATWKPFHRDHRTVAISLIYDIMGHPYASPQFSPTWRTFATTGIASTIYEDHAFSTMPMLADALEEAGCDNSDILSHCRSKSPHVQGCWVLDLILGKE